MVKLLKTFGYILFFICALVFFMPKTSLYHYAEKELEKHKVVFSNEQALDSGLSLKLSDVDISYESIESANVEVVDVKLFLLYNTISIHNIILSDMAASFIPVKVESLEVHYSIVNPLYITANASGEFGEASAKVNILDRNATLLLNPSPLMKKKYSSTLRKLKKNNQGEYRYAKNF